MNILPALRIVWASNVYVDIAVMAFLGYVLTYAFYLGMAEGMLFERWGSFVRGKFWLKPLGGCMLCTSFWAAVLISLAFGHYALNFLIPAGALAVYLTNKIKK